MDYKSLMNKEKVDYFSFYSQRMKELEKYFLLDEELSSKLEEKRNFGYEKYGEYSFQGSFENTLTSPTEEHLEEELIDAINYALHTYYKHKLMNKNEDSLKPIIEGLYNLFRDIKEIKENMS